MVESLTCWKTLIKEALAYAGECWDDVVSTTLSEEGLLRRFDDNFGCEEGEPFTLWTSSRVYFPVVYDGAEWVSSVPRYPNGEKTKHVGGG